MFGTVNINTTTCAGLGGELRVSLLNGFVPREGDEFVVMTFPCRAGSFSNTSTLCDSSAHRYRINETSTNITLTAEACDPPRFVSLGRFRGLFHFRFQGEPGVSYRVDASTDLVNWTNLFLISTPSGILDFIDPESANFPQRFYRAGAQ
jgi:hypothetical protein